jgi:hypothetical protein
MIHRRDAGHRFFSNGQLDVFPYPFWISRKAHRFRRERSSWEDEDWFGYDMNKLSAEIERRQLAPYIGFRNMSKIGNPAGCPWRPEQTAIEDQPPLRT